MQLEQRIVHYVLCDWGRYEEKQIDFSAYNSVTPLYRYMMEGAAGKPIFSSTVLHAGTPQQILRIKIGITGLPEGQQDVVAAKYVFHVKPQGGLWSDAEKAEQLKISYGAYKTALHRARSRLYGYVL